MLGMRLHSAIFSLVAGTPSIAIAYWGTKTQGIMSMAGMEQFMFELDKFEANELTETIKEISNQWDSYREAVLKRADELNQQAKDTPKLMVRR